VFPRDSFQRKNEENEGNRRRADRDERIEKN